MLRAPDFLASVRPREDDVQSWWNFGMLSNVSKNLRPPMTTSRTDAVEAALPCLSSTRGAVELDGSGAREQPRWTAATAAAHQPDALAKELRDFDQVYGPIVSEHPYTTGVPDYRLVPPVSVTSGCMVSTWEPRDELDCCASFTDDDEVLCTAYERVVWTGLGFILTPVESRWSVAAAQVLMARLRDIHDGYGGVLVRPIIDGKRQPTVMLAWHKLQPLGRSVSSFCNLPPDRALTDSYVMAPTDVEEWARPLVYASSPSLLDCAYTPNTSSPLRAWLSSVGYRVSSHRPKNGLQGFQMQHSVLQRSSCAGYAPAVPGGETRSQCSRVVDGANSKSLRMPMCSAVQVCSGPGDSSAHGRRRADGDHARAITGGALSTAVARQGGSADRGTTPTTRNCDMASTVIGGDADSGAQASSLSIGGSGAQLHVDGGGRVGDARRTSAPTTTAPAAAETRVLARTQAPACVPATVQAGAAAAQADAMEAVAEHGVGRMESVGGEVSSGTQSATERLPATARSAATGDGLLIAISASTSVSALSCATDGGGAPGSTQCSDVADGLEGTPPGTTPLTVCEHGGHAQSSKLRAGSCSRALGPGSLSLGNGVDSAQSLLQCANVIGGRRDATHSTAALSGGQGHDDTQVLAVAVGAAGEFGVHRRKVGPFTGTDESSTVPTQGLAQTASVADADRMARTLKQLPGHTCSARSSAATVGANIQSSVPRTEGISSSAHGFAQHADAGGCNGDGVAGLALPPAGDTGTENSTQLEGDGGGRDAFSPSRSPTVPSAGSSITDSTAQSAVSSGGRHDTAHGSAPLCDEHSRVIQVCTCAAVDGVAERCDCHTQTLSSEPPMESAGSNAQGLAKPAGANGNHGDGTCSSGPLSTQGFAQSAVDGGDGGVGTHSSVPLSVLLDGGSHNSGVISTAHGFALTSGVTGAEQRSSFYSAQSLISQSGTASNGTANATTLSLVGGHAGNLQSSHAAQVVAGHDGTMQPMRMGSGPTRGVEQSQMGGCSALLLEATSNAVQDLHTAWGGGDIGNDDTAASAGTGNGDLLLQQQVRAALQHQRPQLLRQQQWLVAADYCCIRHTRLCNSNAQPCHIISKRPQCSSCGQHRSSVYHQRSTIISGNSSSQHQSRSSALAGGTCFHQALCPKVQWTGSPTPTHMAAGPTTEEATLVPTSGIDDASVPFDPGICSKAYATVPAGMGVSTQSPAATRINDSLSSNARLNGEVQRLLLPLTVQRCTECRTVGLLSSTSNTGTGVASCQSSERSASFGGAGGICGVLAPLTAAPNSHDPFTADSNMVLATAPGVVYSSAGGAAVSVSTSNGQRSIAESSSTVECNMEAVQLVAVATTAGACRLAEAGRRKAMVLVQQGTARAGITTSAQCAALVPAQHSPMAGRTAMTTRSINPGEEAARNNGSYTGHTSGEGEAHTVGNSVAICNSGGKAYSYAVLRGDEVRTHDVVVPRGGENDVQPMAHTAIMRQKAHGDVVARGFEDKEPNATGEVGGSSGVQGATESNDAHTGVRIKG
ncbi:hypothetical protein JKP88DRAFT_255356 [Tribonema minus]|uniref:Uncharacterized protein n=1 Tax=Tribonema minus TaxID=303371 RepID=A0A835Z772_9STRA|nr:hypothetical protein JKP88DRAFT_255356 [Tribonema minus]